LVVQLVRMPPCHGGGRGFESRPVRHRSRKALSIYVGGAFHFVACMNCNSQPMSHFVYMLYSESCNVYYEGESSRASDRLIEQYENLSDYPSGKDPRRKVIIQAFKNTSDSFRFFSGFYIRLDEFHALKSRGIW